MLARRAPLRRKGSIYQRRAVMHRDPLDVLWSKVIRTRDPICQLQFLCRGARSVEAAHIIKRQYRATRYDVSNGLGACWACHRWADEHRTELEQRARELIGHAAVNRLLVRSQLGAKAARVEPVAVRQYLREQLKAMEARRVAAT